MLGPPLVTEQLKNERLSRPLALGVLSCDGISSAAYGTEEILRALLLFFGLAAFAPVRQEPAPVGAASGALQPGQRAGEQAQRAMAGGGHQDPAGAGGLPGPFGLMI